MNKFAFSIRAAAESIDFQRDGFGEKLETIVAKMRSELGTYKFTGEHMEAKVQGAILELQEAIAARFGLNINILLNYASIGPGGPMIAFDKAMYNGNHVFFNEGLREVIATRRDLSDVMLIQKLRDTMAQKREVGGVDTVLARISGHYSKLPFDLYMPKVMLEGNRFSDREFVGILLHEIGHGFTLLEYMNRYAAMNEMLAYIVSENFVHVDIKTKEHVAAYICRDGDKDKELMDSLQSSSGQVRALVSLKRFAEKRTSALGTLNYDTTMCESLADNFSARFGYARDVVTGLDKIYDGGTPETGPLGRAKSICMAIGWYALTVASVVFFAVNPAITVIMVYMTVSYWVGVGGEAKFDYGYDRLKVRYQRMREQMIQSLKGMEGNKEYVKEITKQIADIDAIIDRTVIHNTWAQRVHNLLFSKNKIAMDENGRQRLLEEIASSDLYLKAAQLRHI
jgi:hypothetical protein